MRSHLIIMLHGICQTNKAMDPLARYFKNSKYDVLNLSYPSTKYNIEQLADYLYSHSLQEIQIYEKVSFIGFSLGGLVIRAFLNKYKPRNLDSVICIGTPNKGSVIANYCSKASFFQKLYGPAAIELTTINLADCKKFGNTYYKCGVIAGDIKIYNPIMRCNMNDGAVSVNSTKIDNMLDFMVVNAKHNNLPKNKKVLQSCLNFIEHKKFSIQAKEETAAISDIDLNVLAQS